MWSAVEITEHLFWAEHGGSWGMWRALQAYRDGTPVWTGEYTNRGRSVEEIVALTWQPKEQVPAIAAPRMGGTLAFWCAALLSLPQPLEAFSEAVASEDPEAVIHPHPISGPLDIGQRFAFLRFHIDRHRGRLQHRFPKLTASPDESVHTKPLGMKHLLPLLVFLLALSDAVAQTVIPVDRLPAQGVLLSNGWRWHAGDNPDWVKPAFDDRQWQAVDPTKDIMDLPQVRRTGIGWFRLKLAVGQTVRAEPLALLLEQTGASEVYLNGRLLHRFGQIGTSGRATQGYDPRGQPVSLAIEPDSGQTLAVRFAFAPGLPYTVAFARRNQNPLLRVALNGVTNAVRYDQVNRLSGLPLDFLKIGIYFILAIIHLALYVYYPVRRANAYFGLYALCGLLTYGLQARSVGLHSVETLQHTRIAIGVFMTLSHLLRLRALYGLFERPLGSTFWFLAALFLICVPLTVWPYRVGYNYGHGLFHILCFGEQLSVTVLALRQQKRGAGLIVRGVVITVVFGLLHAVLLPYSAGFRDQFYLTGNVGYFLLVNLPFNVADQAIPIAISLHLGLQFAITSRTLATKLTEIETLSARTRAQEAEKLRLIAEQNEQLEQTVRERTDQLQQQADKLRELDGFKSRFFTNLTHEFRTPLTLILGPAEQMLEQTTDSRTRQQVGLIQRNGGRLLRLINQLLDLSKVEAGRMKLTLTPGELVGFVRATVLSFESLANQQGINLRVETAQARLQTAFDHDVLEKILYNLLSNALKFTPNGGQVSVVLNTNEDTVQLTVQDSGAGIPAATLPYVFDRFYQSSAHTDECSMPDHRPQEGTGIGLALTKELVELHGGTIQLTSQKGIGTTVTVRLPVLNTPPTPPLKKGEGLSSIDEQRYDLKSPVPFFQGDGTGVGLSDAPLLLLIEDNDDVRAFIRSSLHGSYRIIEAPGGEAGVRLAQQQVPDLVVTDLMMPGINGYQVCATLKQDERTSHIPVIMLTAKADLDSRLEGLATGADSYLAKPFSGRELLAQVGNLIVGRRQLRDYYGRAGTGLWPTGTTTLPSMEQVFLDRVRSAIETNLADEQYSLDRLSDDLGMSRTQLHRKLKALTDQSPGDLLRLARLQRAHGLLRANVGTVADVAYQVGFGNPANFATSFSRQFGYAPSETRKKAGSLP